MTPSSSKAKRAAIFGGPQTVDKVYISKKKDRAAALLWLPLSGELSPEATEGFLRAKLPLSS